MLSVTWDLLFVSIAAGTGALLLAALSPLLRRRYASRALSVIWLGLALWLVVPVHVTLTAAPVQVTVPAQIARQWRQPLPGRYGGETGQTGAQTGTVPPAQMATGQGVPTSESVVAPQAAGENAAVSALTLRQLALLGWLAGALVLAGWKAFAYRRWHRQIFRWNKPAAPAMGPINAKASANAGLWQPLTVYENPKISTAMLVGVTCPVLLVPENFAAQPQAPLVLLHEYTHHRRCDLLKKLLLQGAVCLHWWNPAVWLLNRQAQQELELACDEAVLAVTGAAASAEYGRALLAAAAGPAPCLVSQFGSEKHQLKARLANLFRTGKRRGVAVVLVCLLVGAGAGLLVACNRESAAQTPETPPQTPTAETTGQTAENATNSKKQAASECIFKFIDWYFIENTTGRYQAVGATAEPTPELLERNYYQPAQKFVTPELLETLRNSQLPYRFDKAVAESGISVTMDSASYTEQRGSGVPFSLTLKLGLPDGSYLLDSITGTLTVVYENELPLVSGVTLQDPERWPEKMLKNAVALAKQRTTMPPQTVPAPAEDAVVITRQAAGATPAEGGRWMTTAQLADVSVKTRTAKESMTFNDITNQSTVVAATGVSPGSYVVNSSVLFELGGAGSTLDYQVSLRVANEKGIQAKIGLLKEDGSVLYQLDGISLESAKPGWPASRIDLSALPAGRYMVALIQPAGATDLLTATLWLAPNGENLGSTFVNTRSVEGNVRADIDILGNRSTRVIQSVTGVTARSAEGLTNPVCTLQEYHFEDATKTMTAHCTYTGTDANGQTQTGTTTFQVALP